MTQCFPLFRTSLRGLRFVRNQQRKRVCWFAADALVVLMDCEQHQHQCQLVGGDQKPRKLNAAQLLAEMNEKEMSSGNKSRNATTKLQLLLEPRAAARDGYTRLTCTTIPKPRTWLPWHGWFSRLQVSGQKGGWVRRPSPLQCFLSLFRLRLYCRKAIDGYSTACRLYSLGMEASGQRRGSHDGCCVECSEVKERRSKVWGRHGHTATPHTTQTIFRRPS